MHSKLGTPQLFGDIRQPNSENYLMFPRVSSETRKYLPISFLSSDVIMADSCYGVPDAALWLFGLFSSRLHTIWLESVGGRLETRIRYSSSIVYNNFPVLVLRESERNEIEAKALEVLDARENHSDKTLTTMYNPAKMPEDLRLAHESLDYVVEKVYRKKPFDNDEERLSHLFNLYETMTQAERNETQL